MGFAFFFWLREPAPTEFGTAPYGHDKDVTRVTSPYGTNPA